MKEQYRSGNMKIKINQIKYILIISILFLYVFRGVASKFRIANLNYALTVLAIMVCITTLSRYYKIHNSIVVYFIVSILALTATVFSLKQYGILAGGIGFIAANINLILWIVFFESMDFKESKDFINRYTRIVIIFALISSLLGIYQTFIDPSLKGFGTSGIYSNAELLASGRYVRRATALFGSAQNYGVFEGVAFCALLYSGHKKFIPWFLELAVLGAGVLVSGSRSASVCVVIAVFFSVIFTLKKKKVAEKKAVLLIFLIIPAALCVVQAAPRLVSGDTLKRLTNFNVSPAIEAYKKAIGSSETIISFLLGRGLGFCSWTTNQFLGERIYTAAYQTAYYSVESYFMHALAQSGILGLAATAGLMVSSILNAWKSHNHQVFLVIFCLFVNQIFTPSFTGLVISFIFWPFVLYPLMQKNKTGFCGG